MKGLRLYKKEKLCSLTAIERLFSPAQNGAGENFSIMAYPWRAVWRKRDENDHRPKCAQFVITVPKRRLRHAVDRVQMRRRMREAYRLNRHLLPDNRAIDMAIIYVAPKLTPYHKSEHAIQKIFNRITSTLSPSPTSSEENKQS